MKTQLEQLSETVISARQWLRQSFNDESIFADHRLQRLVAILNSVATELPVYETGRLVIEFDRTTGRPKVNEELAQRYIRWQIEKAVAAAELNIEIDLLDSDWIDRLLVRAQGFGFEQESEFHPGFYPNSEARAALMTHVKLLQDEIDRIQSALST